MATVIIGWLVRTETAGHHRYWKVGEVNADRAAQLARNTANAHAAKAVASLPTWELPKIEIAPGIISEIVWETKRVAGPFLMPVLESRTDEWGTKGEVTFDIVVPEKGVSIVEGCYRIDGGNWEVYFFAQQCWSMSMFGRSEPHIWPNRVFSSGVLGIAGIVSDNWVLNNHTVMGILAVTSGVEEWIEVIGPDSLILK
jgi:hypothetical protein